MKHEKREMKNEVVPHDVGNEVRRFCAKSPCFSVCRLSPDALAFVVSAPKGRNISAQGKRSAALGSGEHESLALKGRNSRPGVKCHNEGQESIAGLVPPGIALSGLPSINNQTQGGAWRLTPPRLPWADMLRPFGAEQEAVSGLSRKPFRG